MTTIATNPPATTGHHIPALVRKAGWVTWTVFLAAFAILEGVNHGTASWLALVAGLIAPDLTFFAAIGAKGPVRQGQLPRQAVPFYNAAHRIWIPLALAIIYAFAPLRVPALFTFLLAWMLHIGIDRIVGYGLRTADGFLRG
ncbi:DUF4260 family protein [Nocardia aurantiaca]|uniref:DUF4260 family protein n=1 Tax=Nocardia aurantiaca TaxID=2675850 RepID=A0A6I3KV59_9NOCA|nr:DUF4260 family protein [Nocardia aurantiaca]MTE11379.1 DUF4260 family protein [Nocardia aurantiaca]